MKEGQPRTTIAVCEGYDCRLNGSLAIKGILEYYFKNNPNIEVVGKGVFKNVQICASCKSN